MAKKKDVVPVFVDNVEALEAKMQAMREAQKIFATYTQEQVDKIFYAAAVAANKMRIPLAKQAVEETGRGIVEDKVIKNHYAAEYIYDIDLSQDEKCNNHQSASGSKSFYNCSSKGCSGRSSESRSTGRKHWLDRCTVTGTDQYGHERI